MDFVWDFASVFSLELQLAFPIFAVLCIVISLLGYLVGWIEKWSLGDSVYYAFITATTVGYGDFRPVKRRSKCLAVVIAFCGLVLTGILVAVAVSAATLAFSNSPELQKLKSEVEAILEE